MLLPVGLFLTANLAGQQAAVDKISRLVPPETSVGCQILECALLIPEFVRSSSVSRSVIV